MRRIIPLAIGVLVLAGLLAGAYMRRDAIGLELLRRNADRAMARNEIAALPDGLHAAFCGTGSPMTDRNRAGPCLAVVAGQRLFVFDAGGGASETLALMGLPAGAVEQVFLTHFHSDHIDDLGALALQRWAGGGAATPLKVAGPPGVERVVAGFNEAYALDATYRVAHHGAAVVAPSGAGLVAAAFAFPEGADTLVVMDDGGVRVTAFVVDHGPVKPAVGYRVDYKGRAIVISGDTVPTIALECEAKGADLLVMEALSARLVAELEAAAARAQRPGVAKIMDDIQNYHTTPEDAAEVAQRAGVDALALTHLVPPLPSALFDGLFLGEARAGFAGPVWVMRDGDLVSLPAGGGLERRKMLRR
jgi:ribonuclease Z